MNMQLRLVKFFLIKVQIWVLELNFILTDSGSVRFSTIFFYLCLTKMENKNVLTGANTNVVWRDYVASQADISNNV